MTRSMRCSAARNRRSPWRSTSLRWGSPPAATRRGQWGAPAQDFLAETETLDTRLQQQIPATANQNLDQIKERLATIAKERDALQKVLAREFPNYAALSNPQPLTAKEIQMLLSDDEALLQYVV